MDPELWKDLPKDLVKTICARLSTAQIISLCSKEFLELGIRKLHSDIEYLNPRMFALVSTCRRNSRHYQIKLFDMPSNAWHVFCFKTKFTNFQCTLFSSDGGLICSLMEVKDFNKYPYYFHILNPLTKEWNLLPPHPSMKNQLPNILQLVKKRDTKYYEIYVVYGKEYPSKAMIYNSLTEKWTSLDSLSHIISGYESYPFISYGEFSKKFPSIYDVRKSKIIDLTKEFHQLEHQIKLRVKNDCFTLLNDHLFVLVESKKIQNEGTQQNFEEPQFVILEYQINKNIPYLVKLKVHKCEFTNPYFNFHSQKNRFYARLQACRGFLMVNTGLYCFDSSQIRILQPHLYNLSTCKWYKNTTAPYTEENEHKTFETMCELQWDAIP